MKESKVTNGRIGVYVPGHPGANNRGYILRSRYNMEQYLGRCLDTEENVHHCDGNKLNDDIENLELKLHDIHVKDHNNLNNERRVDYDEIKRLREQGLGYKKIAKLIGSNRNTVRYAVYYIENGNSWGRK